MEFLVNFILHVPIK